MPGLSAQTPVHYQSQQPGLTTAAYPSPGHPPPPYTSSPSTQPGLCTPTIDPYFGYPYHTFAAAPYQNMAQGLPLLASQSHAVQIGCTQETMIVRIRLTSPYPARPVPWSPCPM